MEKRKDTLKELNVNPTLQVVLKKMCQVIKVDYDFGKDGWYSTHSWDKKQEKKFKDWFYLFLKNKKKRNEIFTYRETYNKKIFEDMYSWFNLMWGWKQKE